MGAGVAPLMLATRIPYSEKDQKRIRAKQDGTQGWVGRALTNCCPHTCRHFAVSWLLTRSASKALANTARVTVMRACYMCSACTSVFFTHSRVECAGCRQAANTLDPAMQLRCKSRGRFRRLLQRRGTRTAALTTMTRMRPRCQHHCAFHTC